MVGETGVVIEMRAEPDDYDAFWRDLAGQALAIAPESTIEPSTIEGAQTVRYTSLGGLRVGGWLTVPPDGFTSVVVVAHGYGGRAELDPRWAPVDAAVFYPVARGMAELSLIDGVPSFSREHVLHGIESRETYVHGGCAADVWCAANALEEVLEVSLGESRGGMRLSYFGPSFGGGIGAMALPWDARFDAASLYVPSFGAHALRLAQPCVGSGDAVARWLVAHPESWGVLDYFDAAVSARRLRVPTIIAPALDDPSVPPVGQWAVADAVPQEFRTVATMTAGHREYPEERSEMDDYARMTRGLFAAR